MTTDRFEKRRIATKQTIQETFVTMLQSRAFNDITVREIAEEAGIGFKTFYRYYKDKTELTQAILSDFVEKLREYVLPPLSLEAAEANVTIVLKQVRDNAATVRAIGQMPNRDDLAQPLIQFAFAEALRLQVAALGGESAKDQKQREMVAYHFVHSQLSLFYWWVFSDMALPLEEMAEMIIKMIIRPIWEL